MNEAETRAELIDPMLQNSGWGIIEHTKVHREFRITNGEIKPGGNKAKPEIADYVLSYKNRKLAVIEAKSDIKGYTEGVAQAKTYAQKLAVDYTYSTNGKELYEIHIPTGRETKIQSFPTPEELWENTFSSVNEWKNKFDLIPTKLTESGKTPRYYQEIAINRTLDSIAEDKNKILLTLATGTGKTFIAFQIAWKLFEARWNLQKDGHRRPRILFLADRNILANQAYNSFSAFDEDALVRISPLDIRRRGSIPTNGNIYFTIFQSFMSGTDGKQYFGDYPKDFFDLIIIDECHRGGANDESNWRGILEYFSPAVQLGLTATPKRKGNVDTYEYFGEPIYTYSLKEGVNDGFLTPFRLKRIQTTMDEYVYTNDDDIIEGEIEEGRVYKEDDFNRVIKIEAREKKRVQIVLDSINQGEKTIIFCANQAHALAVRDLVNQMKKSTAVDYCARVTANDGALGDQYLRDFQDNEKNIPTILTTSQKLSTGVDALNVRNIVLMRPVNSMIEFKQIIGRGTRLFDGKDYFTIYDFVDAYHHFSDPEWDGEPIEDIKRGEMEHKETDVPAKPKDNAAEKEEKADKMVLVELAPGKEMEIQHMVATTFWDANGKPISAGEFIKNFYGVLPEVIDNEAELRKIWSRPDTRAALLTKLEGLGYGLDELNSVRKIIKAENSDIFDVLSALAFEIKPITKEQRVTDCKEAISDSLSEQEKEFIDFVLSKYIEDGSSVLDDDQLPRLLNLKYGSIQDAGEQLGGIEKIRKTYLEFQQKLYSKTRK